MSSNTATATQEEVTAKVPEPKKPVQFEEDDMVAVIHRNWGSFDTKSFQPLIPADRTTYLDRITFTGGVARNVPYEMARKWVKLGLIDKTYIFPNNAQEEDFARATGRNPVALRDLASAVNILTAEKAATILGDEKAEAFARNLLSLVRSRKKEEEDGTR